MNKNIILAGVGGQGILTIAAIIDTAALDAGLNIKQAEVHGMSQRGGAVQSHLRISDDTIYSDLIASGTADIIISVEPMESLRYLPFLSAGGILVTSTDPFKNIQDYPDETELMQTIRNSAKCILVDTATLAKEAGNSKTYNVIMLGAASPYIGIDSQYFESAIEKLFSTKGREIQEINLKAFRLGLNIGKQNKEEEK